jgi:simple sugar transport system permease protein
MIAEILVKSGPILFCAVSFLVAWKAGLFNIGAEGQFLMGALAASFAATRIPIGGPLSLLLALLAGCLAGSVWAAIAAWMSRRRGVNEALSTILLNFLAAGVVSLSVHSFLQERARTFPQSETVPETSRLPLVWPGTRLHAGILLAAGVAALAGWFFARTPAGFRVRATGLGARAAEFAGMNVSKIRWRAFLVSGAIAGLGGAVELCGVAGRLFESFSPGYGYLGLAAAVVARLSPGGAILSSLAFGALNSAGGWMQRTQGISSSAATALEALILIAAMTFHLPAALRPSARTQPAP